MRGNERKEEREERLLQYSTTVPPLFSFNLPLVPHAKEKVVRTGV